MSQPHRQKKEGRENGGSKKEAWDKDMDARLNDAEAKIWAAQASAERLHQQWRTQLRRLSFFVTAMSVHQAQSSMGACLKDIKAVNAKFPNTLSGFQASMAASSDSLVYICAILMSVALTYFLGADPPEGASGTKYVVANAFVPAILTLFFTRSKLGCIDDLLEQAGLEGEARVHSFPVTVIFHIIVTLCVWFMGMQARQSQHNLSQVQALRKQIREQESKKKS